MNRPSASIERQLDRLYNLLDERLPQKQQRKQWARKAMWLLAAIMVLAIVNFDQNDGSITIPQGAELRLLTLENKNYPLRLSSDAYQQGGSYLLYSVDGFMDGWRFITTDIRLNTISNTSSNTYSITMSPMKIPCSLRVRLWSRHYTGDNDGRSIQAHVWHNYALSVGEHIIPIYQIMLGSDVAEIRLKIIPKRGIPRLKANIEKLFGLLF